jgi:hypothetical protein
LPVPLSRVETRVGAAERKDVLLKLMKNMLLDPETIGMV